MKKLLLYLLLLFCGTASAQLQQVWKTDYQISSDTFQTFGYKTDSAGNFYLYGWQHNKVFLQKHNAEGQIEWTINDNSIVEQPKQGNQSQLISNSRITDIYISSNHDIYLIGITSVQVFNNPNYASYIFMTKVNPSLFVHWKKNWAESYSELGGILWNHSAIITGNILDNVVYLLYSRSWTKMCDGRRDLDFGIVALDTSGVVKWFEKYVGDTLLCTKDIVTSFFFQDSKIGLSGFATSPNPSFSKLVNIKLDKVGNLVNRSEEKQFIVDPFSDQTLNLYLPVGFTTKGLTKGNTTYITAESADSIRTEQRNLLVLKYDETLNRIWRYDLEKDSSINLKIEKSVVDDSCNLLVSGIWKEHGEHKAFFVKLDSSGNERYRDTFSSNVEVNLNLLNKHQQSVLLTTSLNGSAYNTSIRKYHASGDLWWNQPLLFPGKILHAFLDSCYLYLVIQNEKTVSYVKLRDTTCKDDPFLILHTQSLTQNSVSMGWSFNDTFSARKGFVAELRYMPQMIYL